jgi:hypothetical protein
MSRLIVCRLCERDGLPRDEWFAVPGGDFIGPALMQQHLADHARTAGADHQARHTTGDTP